MPVLKIKKEDGTWEVVSGSSGNNVEVDPSLEIEGMAADSKAVGDAVNLLQEKVDKCANVVGMNSGNIISLTNSAHTPMAGLRIFGKTTQNGTPTPDTPVPLVSVGDGGSVTVKVGISETDENPQTLTVTTLNGLPGIPVASGGNYTDSTGQQWVCDEVDFGRGVYVQRVKKNVIKPSNLLGIQKNADGILIGRFLFDTKAGTPPMSSMFMGVLTSNSQWQIVENVAAHATVNGYVYLTILAERTGLGTVTNDATTAIKNYLNNNPVDIVYATHTPIETALSAEQLNDYAALHTNYPNTTVFNDGGAGMEVKYYTPTTAVQMVHSPSDEGKILSIDEHGCVILSDSVAGSIDIDFEGASESESTPINADTLGGYSAEEYLKHSDEINANALGNIPAEEYARKDDLSEYVKTTDLENLDTSGISMELLWENASPNSAFSSQKITMPNMEEYQFILIDVLGYTNEPYRLLYWSVYDFPSIHLTYSFSTGYGRRRLIYNSSTEIQIEDNLHNNTTNNSYIIPYKIYGIKGVSV